MPRVHKLQSSFNSGELDPKLAARTDIKHYYQGASDLTNVLCLPHGGVVRRPGQKYIDDVHHQLDLITPDSATAPEGGTVGNGYDDDASTVVLTTTAIGSINPYVVLRYDLGASPLEVEFIDIWQIKLDASGTEPDMAVQWSDDDAAWTTFETFTVTEVAADHRFDTNLTHRYWRLARVGSTSQGSKVFSVGDFHQHTENSTYGNVRFIPFEYSTTQDYILVMTDETLAVFKDGVEQAHIHTPYLTADIPGVHWTQSADTLIMVHEDYAPISVTRSSDTVWTQAEISFSNIPQFDFGSGDEDVWSATRGWPSTVTFHEARLWFGGARSLPQSVFASVISDFYNMDVGSAADDDGIFTTIDTDQVNAIKGIISNRNLQIFTTGGEFYIPQSPITPTNIAIQRQTTFGLKFPMLPPVAVDGETLFLQRRGNILRSFLYSFGESAYTSASLSLLSAHIMNAPVSLAAQQGSGTYDTNYIYVVNGDGTMAVFQVQRDQEIAAWSKFTTDGLYKAVGVLNDEVYVVCERTINSVTVQYIELFDPDYYMDASEKQTLAPSDTVNNLGHLEAEEIRVRLDGAVMLDRTVASGSITMEREGTAFEGGMNFNTQIISMPLNVDFQDGPILTQDKRIVSVVADVFETLGISINGELLADRAFGEDTLDAPVTPYTGIKEIYLMGWDRQAKVTIAQADPTPMTILGIDVEVQA